MFQRSTGFYVVFIVAIVLLQACTALQSFPVAARAGDTISLAVGSPQGMTKANTSAFYLPDSGGVITLPIRSIFNVYADKKSELYQFGGDAGSLTGSSKHESWLTVLAIDLPSGLSIGTGKVQLTSTATYSDITRHINDVLIDLEIISGAGAPNPFTFEHAAGTSQPGDLSKLEPLPHALINPPENTQNFGAIEIQLSLPNSLGTALTDVLVRVVADDMMSNTASNRNVIWGVNNGNLTLLLMSPSGTLKGFESRFSVVLHSSVSFTGTPAITAINYYDVDGNAVAGPLITDYSVTLEGV